MGSRGEKAFERALVAAIFAFTFVPFKVCAAEALAITEVETPSGSAICGFVSSKWTPGKLKSTGGFVSHSEKIRATKRAITNANADKKLKLEAKLRRLITQRKEAAPVCEALPKPITHDPTPGPTPAATATSRPTATPTRSSGCYDAQRNTSCFGIPSGLVGNETRGAALWPECAGCHTESSKRNKTYSQISSALSTIPQMQPFRDNFSAQDIADLVAYLNRYNPNQ